MWSTAVASVVDVTYCATVRERISCGPVLIVTRADGLRLTATFMFLFQPPQVPEHLGSRLPG